MGGPQVSLVQVAVGKHLPTLRTLVHRVLLVNHQVNVHALDGGKKFATVETHKLWAAGGVEGHVALLELLLAGLVGDIHVVGEVVEELVLAAVSDCAEAADEDGGGACLCLLPALHLTQQVTICTKHYKKTRGKGGMEIKST